MTNQQIKNTIAHLKACIAARKAGKHVSYTTDSHWLVDMAINRRAGWLDDPGFTRGSCMPVNGKYPAKAEGDRYFCLRRLASKINTPRLIVRAQELGEWRELLLGRLPNRITTED